MATAAVAPEPLLTAEQFAQRPDPGHPEELVRGRIVPMPVPKPRHGEICSKADRILGVFVEQHDLGRVLSNDSGVITERGPDTVRGADVAFYSYDRVPRGPLPDRYLDVTPELVVEVLSPSDRWPKVLQKVGEYLEAGVLVVVVLDDHSRSAHVFGADGPNRVLGPADELTFPGLLAEFRGRGASVLRVTPVGPGRGGSLALAIRWAVEPWPCRLTTPELVELLTLPTGFGPARRVPLDHRHGRRFFNPWAFVRWIPGELPKPRETS